MGATTTRPPLYDEIPDNRHRFVNYVGRGFAAGAACGSAWLFLKGLLHNSSPSGGRLAGGVDAVRSSAPRVAGVFGAYSALYCAIERAMALARDRDDPWNCIAACAASLGLFNARCGGRAVALNALYGAAVGVVFEGADWLAGEWDARFASHPPPTRTDRPGQLAPAITPRPTTDSHGPDGDLSTLSEKDLEVLELSRKLLPEKMTKGFHSPAPRVVERFPVSPWWESYLIRR